MKWQKLITQEKREEKLFPVEIFRFGLSCMCKRLLEDFGVPDFKDGEEKIK